MIFKFHYYVLHFVNQVPFPLLSLSGIKQLNSLLTMDLKDSIIRFGNR